MKPSSYNAYKRVIEQLQGCDNEAVMDIAVVLVSKILSAYIRAGVPQETAISEFTAFVRKGLETINETKQQ